MININIITSGEGIAGPEVQLPLTHLFLRPLGSCWLEKILCAHSSPYYWHCHLMPCLVCSKSLRVWFALDGKLINAILVND